MKQRGVFVLVLGCLFAINLKGQHSVARQWNEALLEGIRNDFARPTVHARNLFHASIAMYDAWAVYHPDGRPYLLGNTVHGYTNTFDSVPEINDPMEAAEEAMSYAMFRLLSYRFRNSPGKDTLKVIFTDLMNELGYDTAYTSTDYQSGDPAALGNYIAQSIIDYGLQDGSNEIDDYANLFYKPVNPPMEMDGRGNPNIVDPNRWQQLKLEVFIDQSGNVLPIEARDFLGPEWGSIAPFSLTDKDLTVYERDGHDYRVYHDPGPPPMLDTTSVGGLSEEYKWNFALVAAWSSHLDPTDGVMWDISPASIGNIQEYPTTITALRDFYDLEEGGDPSLGHTVNPHTGQPYEPQIVPRGDYTRILAEFWADGPDSETPPGHWFTILNYVNDQPQLERRFGGKGEVLDPLEWDVKAYFMLGGAMHDVAITAWGIKGWYDYIRPVSAIRYMADRGQSTDPDLPRYHPAGIPLIPGLIDLVTEDDFLAGNDNENVNKIQLRAWRGPNFIENPETDQAGVGQGLAENWWPYQRPSFVTPPFAGYISGHSTYSSAAARLLTLLTGDPFFPGGVGEFPAPQNEFLVFEQGPSVDVVLQWATYKDAADQCSLSRIWGGIHPPADDVPGRIIGEVVGKEAFEYALTYFFEDIDNDGYVAFLDCDDMDAMSYPGAEEIVDGIDNDCDGEVDNMTTAVWNNSTAALRFFPNPFTSHFTVDASGLDGTPYRLSMYNVEGRAVWNRTLWGAEGQWQFDLDEVRLPTGVYQLVLSDQLGKPLATGKAVKM